MSAALIGLGATALNGVFGGNDAKEARRRMGDTIARYRASRPEGYLTANDYGEAGRIREGYGTLARTKGGQRAGQLITRYRQLGLDTSQPGLVARGLDRIGGDTADITLQGSRAGDEMLYDTRMNREAAQRDKERDIFGSEMGLYEQDQRRGEARQAAFMNGLNEFMPTISSFFGRGRLGGRGLPDASLKAASLYDSTQDLVPR